MENPLQDIDRHNQDICKSPFLLSECNCPQKIRTKIIKIDLEFESKLNNLKKFESNFYFDPHFHSSASYIYKKKNESKINITRKEEKGQGSGMVKERLRFGREKKGETYIREVQDGRKVRDV